MKGDYRVSANFDFGTARIVDGGGRTLNLQNRRQLDNMMRDLEDYVSKGIDAIWQDSSDEITTLLIPRDRCTSLLGHLKQIAKIADDRQKTYEVDF